MKILEKGIVEKGTEDQEQQSDARNKNVSYGCEPTRGLF